MWSSLFGRDKQPPAPPPAEPAAPSGSFAEEMTAALREVSWTARRAGNRLPVAALPRLGLIEDLLHPLLAHLAASPPTVDEEIAVRGIVADYLPTTLNAYLSMNTQFATMARPDGRTPGDDLLDQLATLLQATTELAQAVYAHDAQELQVQGRFLQSKFRGTDLDL